MSQCCNDACLHTEMLEGQELIEHLASTIVKDEAARRTNETQRQANEAKRQETFNDLKTRTESNLRELVDNNAKFAELDEQFAEMNEAYRTITSTELAYAIGTDGITPPTKEWKSVPLPCPQGQYLWTRTILHFNKGDDVTTYSVAYEGRDGANGVTAEVSGFYSFKVNNAGHLIVTYADQRDSSQFTLKSDGHLYYTLEV